jgi:hypothetical protein
MEMMHSIDVCARYAHTVDPMCDIKEGLKHTKLATLVTSCCADPFFQEHSVANVGGGEQCNAAVFGAHKYFDSDVVPAWLKCTRIKGNAARFPGIKNNLECPAAKKNLATFIAMLNEAAAELVGDCPTDATREMNEFLRLRTLEGISGFLKTNYGVPLSYVQNRTMLRVLDGRKGHHSAYKAVENTRNGWANAVTPATQVKYSGTFDKFKDEALEAREAARKTSRLQAIADKLKKLMQQGPFASTKNEDKYIVAAKAAEDSEQTARTDLDMAKDAAHRVFGKKGWQPKFEEKVLTADDDKSDDDDAE